MRDWVEIYDDLREKIKSGKLRAEAEIDKSILARDVDDSAYRRAIERLLDEGVLISQSKEKTIVATPRARSKRSALFIDDYKAQGRKPSIRTMIVDLLPLGSAPQFVKSVITESDGSLILRHRHLQLVDDIPHALADSYYPFELLAKQFDAVKRQPQDIWAILAEMGFRPEQKEETLYVDTPTTEERSLLEITSMPALPVVRLDCVIRCSGKIIEICLLCDRSDLYEFTYKIDL